MLRIVEFQGQRGAGKSTPDLYYAIVQIEYISD